MLTAIILAGGESSRLRPLGDKSLQRFMGETLLRRHVLALFDAGAREMVIVAGPRNEAAIRAECLNLPADLHLQFVQQPEALGMGDAVRCALAVVAPDSMLYLTQTHDVLDAAFHREMLAQVEAAPDHLRIAAKAVQNYFPGGYLIPVEDQPSGNAPFAIQGIIEKPGASHEPSQWINLVAHIIPSAAELLQALEAETDGDQGDLYERALTRVMAAHPSVAVPHANATASLKYPWHMLDIMELLLSQITTPQIAATARIAASATVQGNVIIADDVRLFPGAAVVGPAYIGRGVIVGNGALVRESMIGAHSIVGYSTEVARSWIGTDVWFHTNYVGDSIIDDNVSFGSGTVTGNLRLDEQTILVRVKGERVSSGRTKLGQIIGSGTRIGINASLMPGIVIGRDTFVGAGVILGQDVPDGKRVTVRQDLVWDDHVQTRSPEDRAAFRSRL